MGRDTGYQASLKIMVKIQMCGHKWEAEVVHLGIREVQAFWCRDQAERWAEWVRQDIERGGFIPRKPNPRFGAFRRAVHSRLVPLSNRLFDTIHRVNTQGFSMPQDLDSDSPQRGHSNEYLAVWTANIKRLLRVTANLVPFDRATFVDLGCGEGKACLIAQRFGFKVVRGVEFDRSLLAAARRNLETGRFVTPDSIDFIEADCSEYRLDAAEHLVLFMFNPFDDTILTAFLDNNADTLRNAASCHVLLANDVWRIVLRAYGFAKVYENPIRKISVWKIEKTS